MLAQDSFALPAGVWRSCTRRGWLRTPLRCLQDSEGAVPDCAGSGVLCVACRILEELYPTVLAQESFALPAGVWRSCTRRGWLRTPLRCLQDSGGAVPDCAGSGVLCVACRSLEELYPTGLGQDSFALPAGFWRSCTRLC